MELFVIADAENGHAIRLYESTVGALFPGGSVVFGYSYQPPPA